MMPRRFLILGGGQGWHADQLAAAAGRLECELVTATYESLAASLGDDSKLQCAGGDLANFDAVLTRTMPAGTLEQITFRLAVLHAHARQGSPVINPPRALEIAIDKFAALAEIERLGYPVPPTAVVQSRGEAIEAFRHLGGDCVVKPIFGGEGRGVMRIRDPELAWYTFSTLEQLGAVFYVQQFIPPGGADMRLLVVGDQVHAVRRTNRSDFRTNVANGGSCQRIEPSPQQAAAARRITAHLGLAFASVDMIDAEDGKDRVIEVNAVPGWRGAQRVLPVNIAEQVIEQLCHAANAQACHHRPRAGSP